MCCLLFLFKYMLCIFFKLNFHSSSLDLIQPYVNDHMRLMLEDRCYCYQGLVTLQNLSSRLLNSLTLIVVRSSHTKARSSAIEGVVGYTVSVSCVVSVGKRVAISFGVQRGNGRKVVRLFVDKVGSPVHALTVAIDSRRC